MYEMMFIAGAVLAGIFLVFAIVFFVKDDVAKRIGDLTGWTAKHEIKKRTQMGVEAVSKNEALHAKDADIVVKNLEISEDEATDLLSDEATELLVDEATTLLASEETELLVDEATTLLVNEETELLVDEETILLSSEETEFLTEEATTLLTNEDEFIDEDETGLLTSGDTEWLMRDRPTYETAKEETLSKGVEMPSIFEVEEETVVVHTEESI